MRTARTITILLTLWISLIGCGHRPTADLSRLESLWRHGDHQAALTEARAVIRRTAEANGVLVSELRARAHAIRERLSTEPIPPDDAIKSESTTPFPMTAGQLDKELQESLQNPEALVMIRSAITIGELKLTRHSMGLLAMITRPGPVRLKRPYPSLEEPMMAWLTSKQVALDSLVQLSRR